MQRTFVEGSPKAVASLVSLVLVDATFVLLSLRFVGVGASDVPAIEVYVAFLCVYPLTLFPFMGLGIAEAVLLATFVGIGGDDIEAAAVAGLVVWRTMTLLGPVLLGTISMGVWRHGQRKGAAAATA